MAHFDPAAAAVAPLADGEIADAEALVAASGWNQTDADWRMFRQLGTVRAIRDAGRVIATAATLPYGSEFAWISMVLIRKDYQRRGLATRLLRLCVDDLVAARLVPALDATPAGREVYRALGFQDSWSFQRLASLAPRPWPHAGDPAPGLTIRPVSGEIWPKLCRYDAAIFGANRGALLAALRSRAPHIALYAERAGRVVGLMFGRDGRVATQIGPAVADDDATARVLLAHALAKIAGPIFIDVPDAKTEMLALLAAHGFTPQRPLTRMLLGRSEAFDDGRRTYAVVGPEFG